MQIKKKSITHQRQLFQIELDFTRSGSGIKYNLRCQGKCFKPAVLKILTLIGCTTPVSFYLVMNILPTLHFQAWPVENISYLATAADVDFKGMFSFLSYTPFVQHIVIPLAPKVFCGSN